MSKHGFAALLPSKRPSLSSRRPAWCGLGLVQIPPDVGQVEAIKGNASAPYGSAAIAGVLNLVSRRPAAEPIHEFLVNRSTLGARRMPRCSWHRRCPRIGVLRCLAAATGKIAATSMVTTGRPARLQTRRNPAAFFLG